MVCEVLSSPDPMPVPLPALAAKKKIFPSLFALFYGGNLPHDFVVVGYSRTRMTDEEFRERIGAMLPCRVDAGPDCERKMAAFLSRVRYIAGNYDSTDDFSVLDAALCEIEGPHERANRLFYLSLPPSMFLPSCQCLSSRAPSPSGWTRVIVEKPFGRDLQSYQELDRWVAARQDARTCAQNAETSCGGIVSMWSVESTAWPDRDS